MTRPVWDKYIHKFVDWQGVTRYAVAERDESAGQFTRPVDYRTRKLTGASFEFCRNLNEFGGYLTRREALRRARYLFGESNDDD